MLRPILRYGQPVLQAAASPVDLVTSATQQIIDDLIETMHAAPGVGLAAPQVGLPLRIVVVDLSVGRRSADLIALINPEFVERSGLQLEEEGCLSVPGFNATVPRPARVVVRGLDRSGESHTVEGTGLLARALQHEMDHLDGVLFVDRLRRVRRASIVRGIERLQRTGRW